MLSFSSVEDVIIFHGVNVIIFEGLYVIIFKCRGCYNFYGVNVIIFYMLSFLGVEDVIIFHDVNVMITINDNINDNTKYVQGKMITYSKNERKNAKNDNIK
jgi:hypothetical protein